MTLLSACAPPVSSGGKLAPAVETIPGQAGSIDAVAACNAKGGHLETMEFFGPGTNSGMTEVCM
ncbi:MAG: hypothetical protein ABI832_03765 [bacterium]